MGTVASQPEVGPPWWRAYMRGLALVASYRRVRERIEQYELARTIDSAHFFQRLDEAVAECVRRRGAAWRCLGVGVGP
jgi:hypothetical protein